MSTQLHNSFTVNAPVEQAWAVLTDIKRVAACVPGAELTEVVDERTYKGKIGVRLGPVQLAFAGRMEFQELDAASHRAVIKANGSELKGRGGANALVTCVLAAEGGATRIDIDTALDLVGQVAQYGRGAGMIAGVAQQLTNQFAAALEADIKTSQAPAAAPGEPAPAVAPPPPKQEIRVVQLVLRAALQALRDLIRSLWRRRA